MQEGRESVFWSGEKWLNNVLLFIGKQGQWPTDPTEPKKGSFHYKKCFLGIRNIFLDFAHNLSKSTQDLSKGYLKRFYGFCDTMPEVIKECFPFYEKHI